MRNSKLILSVVFTIFTIVVYSQKSSQEKSGDKAYDIFSYDKAIEKYTKADSLTLDGQRKLALSYLRLGDNKNSESVFERFINSDQSAKEDLFMYASVLRKNGKHKLSDTYMKKFNDADNSDKRGQNFVSQSDLLDDLLQDKGAYTVYHLDINTPEEDFGTAYFGDKIAFSSSRIKGGKKQRKYNATKLPFLDVYVSNRTNLALTNPVKMGWKVNKHMHEGPVSFNGLLNYAAITRNNYNKKSSDEVVKLEIFFMEKDEKGNWGKAIPFTYNNKEYSVAHPHLTSDGNTMYFSSDMPGGYGGSDIYFVKRDATGVWGRAVNLGPNINTEGQEMFPFFHERQNVLFFSSNGNIGLGGLDVFVSSKDKVGNYTKPLNVGAPINSITDDFSFIIDEEMESGYFSSDREGGKGKDDIYSFEVDSAVFYKKDIKEQVLADIPNMVTNIHGNGTLNSSVCNHISREEMISLIDSLLLLRSNNELSIQTAKPTLAFDLREKIDIKNINFDLNKADIRLDASIELDKIVAYMNLYADMIVTLQSHTDCRGSFKSNMKLSNQRAKSSIDYIRSRISRPERITGRGYGESFLLNDCDCSKLDSYDCPDYLHEQNRRTEFKVLHLGQPRQ